MFKNLQKLSFSNNEETGKQKILRQQNPIIVIQKKPPFLFRAAIVKIPTEVLKRTGDFDGRRLSGHVYDTWPHKGGNSCALDVSLSETDLAHLQTLFCIWEPIYMIIRRTYILKYDCNLRGAPIF